LLDRSHPPARDVRPQQLWRGSARDLRSPCPPPSPGDGQGAATRRWCLSNGIRVAHRCHRDSDNGRSGAET